MQTNIAGLKYICDQVAPGWHAAQCGQSTPNLGSSISLTVLHDNSVGPADTSLEAPLHKRDRRQRLSEYDVQWPSLLQRTLWAAHSPLKTPCSECLVYPAPGFHCVASGLIVIN